MYKIEIYHAHTELLSHTEEYEDIDDAFERAEDLETNSDYYTDIILTKFPLHEKDCH